MSRWVSGGTSALKNAAHIIELEKAQ